MNGHAQKLIENERRTRRFPAGSNWHRVRMDMILQGAHSSSNKLPSTWGKIGCTIHLSLTDDDIVEARYSVPQDVGTRAKYSESFVSALRKGFLLSDQKHAVGLDSNLRPERLWSGY